MKKSLDGCCHVVQKTILRTQFESSDINTYLFTGGSGGREKAAKNQQGDREADPKGQASLSRHPPSPPPRRRRVRQVYPG